MSLRELLRAIPCWPVFVDRDCYEGLRAGKAAAPAGTSYSVVIDRYTQLAFDAMTHRTKRRELKTAKARGADVNPNSLKIEK